MVLLGPDAAAPLSGVPLGLSEIRTLADQSDDLILLETGDGLLPADKVVGDLKLISMLMLKTFRFCHPKVRNLPNHPVSRLLDSTIESI